ncbi:Stress enhanced protein 2, chloroplastic [Quillaja saponaria]|uniref:Stress enhanced protein 2, chloroplastic n=1 Tax=Quillaja saponaria TaxID=32244 RepID=A0AAD7PII7_QUISA|nr:Stress enhanced protein 2, chloroplastic [Quillaja saponaria]
MTSVARALQCKLSSPRPAVRMREQSTDSAPVQVSIPKPKLTDPDSANIVLQPRLCTLRSYASDRAGVFKTTKRDAVDDVSPFFATLSEYIESFEKSQDFETISGRLAMIVFAASVTEELVTGNSVFRKMDVQGIAEAGGVCLGAVTCAALFAWFSSARNRVGRIFTISCNTFIDSLIDQIVDGLFYESELKDWSDEL